MVWLHLGARRARCTRKCIIKQKEEGWNIISSLNPSYIWCYIVIRYVCPQIAVTFSVGMSTLFSSLQYHPSLT